MPKETSEVTLPKFQDGPASDSVVTAERAYLLAVSGPHSGAIFTLTEGTMTMGRDPAGEIFLKERDCWEFLLFIHLLHGP